MVAYETDSDLLRRIAQQATVTAEIVESGVRRRREIATLKAQMWGHLPASGEQMAHFEECIVSGRANPMGIVMDVRREGMSAVAHLNLGAAFEGAPKRAHGGIVAAILDDIMGYVLTVENTPAYTGTMQVRYAAPTPVETDLVATAWMESRDGRKLTMQSTLKMLDGTILAEGSGVFIAIRPERLRDWQSTPPKPQ